MTQSVKLRRKHMTGDCYVRFCERLKSDIRTSHIPIILLTALKSNKQQIEGFNVGADDYITKPFNAHILSARVKNLLDSRKKLKELFGKEQNYDVSMVTSTQVDKELLLKVIDIIESNLALPDFDISNLYNELNLGRSIFFQKIKALTNKTPHELITGLKMKRALNLLLYSQKNISEICFEVGYSEPSNFTRLFKKYYGVSPKQYQKKNKPN